MARQIVPAVSAFAARVGYSRAVRVGAHVHVAGTAPAMADGSDPPADAYGQARRCLEIIAAALADVGATPAHVVRTRIYLTRAEDIAEVGRAHAELFAEAKPATTALVVAALLDPRWLVEIEADAIVEEDL
jgi:enamine deaminase RidA (YjgF/YER057c/UK114 family)